MARPKGGAGNSKAVLDALREHGPMTNRALVKLTGITQVNMNNLLYKLHQKPRMVYITSWEELTHDGFNTRPQACYAVGQLKDAKKPPPLGHTLASKRRRENMRKRVNSIFNLGAVNAKEIYNGRTERITHDNRGESLHKASYPANRIQHGK